MVDGSNVANQQPGDGRYELVDRTGRSLGEIPFATLIGMIRQGRLFRSDNVIKNGNAAQPMKTMREFAVVFEEVNPVTPRLDSLRSTPEFAGEADQLSLARAFVRIYRGRHNGRLFVVTDDALHEKAVVFREGVPVNASSNIKEEWLGEVLRNQGLIDQATFDEAVQASQADGPRLGEVLVDRNKISARQLYRALAVQAMDRLLKLFQRGGTFHFVLDETAGTEEILLLAGPRDVLETCLSASMAPKRVTEILAESGDPVLRVEVPPDLEADLNDGDRTVLAILEERRPLSAVLPQVAESLRLTLAEARARVLFLMVFDCVHIGNPRIEALESQLSSFQGMNHFDVLDIRRGSTAEEVVQAYHAQVAALEELTEGRPSRAAAQIRNLLDKALAVLRDPDQRPLYERALQLGIDFDQPQARTKIKHEMLVERGRGLLIQQAYTEAAETFEAAARLTPDDAETEIDAGWAHFLAGTRQGTSARDAKRRVERAVNLAPTLDRGHLVLGKIDRLMGDLTGAEGHLKRAIQLNSSNLEAEAELRGIHGADRRKRPKGVSSGSPIHQLAYGIIMAVLVATGLLYVGANVITGGATLWPDVDQREFEISTLQSDPKIVEVTHIAKLRLNFEGDKLVEAALRMGAAKDSVTNKSLALGYLSGQDFGAVLNMLRTLRDIPLEEQVLGSIEYYYVSSDGYWWTRRVTLLVLGLLFIVLINRERITDIPWLGENTNLILAAPFYGIVIGFCSGTPQVASSPGAVLGMTLFHVLSEQVFFIWFVALGLMKYIRPPVAGAVLAGALFGLYHLSYFATLQIPVSDIIIQLLQISIFAGGAYSLLAWRTGGVLAPLLAHLAVNVTMMARTLLS